MNRLKTENLGGLPYAWEDFRFEQQAYRDAFFALASPFGITKADSFVIQGINARISGGNIVWDAGIIALGGEICAVDAGTMSTSGMGSTGGVLNAWWVVASTYDSAGNIDFKDGSSQQIYEIRKATLYTANVGVPSDRFVWNGPTFLKKIKDTILDPDGFEARTLTTSDLHAVKADGSNSSLATTSSTAMAQRWYFIGKLCYLFTDVYKINTADSPIDHFIVKLPPGVYAVGVNYGSGTYMNVNSALTGDDSSVPEFQVTNDSCVVYTGAGFGNPNDSIYILPRRNRFDKFFASGSYACCFRSWLCFEWSDTIPVSGGGGIPIDGGLILGGD